ncbi:MAG: SPOR domain-containing protein, partial [Bacteroidetes bacterium]|nr:SPOR domain-containing protein [Bacteroidota bacterium]
ETITPPPVAVESAKKEVIIPPRAAEPAKEETKIIPSEPIKKEAKTPPTKANVPVTAIPSSMGKTYRVQVGAFNSKPALKGVPEPSKVVLDNGTTKYFSGNFATYAEAARRKKQLIEKGFSGAFVVSFENGKIVK